MMYDEIIFLKIFIDFLNINFNDFFVFGFDIFVDVNFWLWFLFLIYFRIVCLFEIGIYLKLI